MIGRTLGRFHILEELGRGGAATVWKARDELLGRFVAVKVLDPSSRGPSAVHRFRREGAIAALLDHPAIVPVYGADECDGLAYLVMKLIDGETLAEYLRHRLPPIRDVIDLAIPVCEALRYAHDRAVIHRDITARNIMRTREGGVYVLDFGLSRAAGQYESSSRSLAGTPPYVAPEIYENREPDARSDVYSFGVVLYELLTGNLPFRGDRIELIQYQVLCAELRPPTALRAEIGSGLEALVVRLLSRDPGKRPLIDEAVHQLRALRATPSTESAGAERAPTPESSRRPPTPAGKGHGPRGRGARAPAPDRLIRSYLLVLPVEASGADPALRRVLDGVAEALRAGLAHADRFHVVSAPPGAAGMEDPRELARAAGANLLLRSSARTSGTSLRITFAVEDPESGVRSAGGNVDGSLLQPFELEDRLLAAVREALGVRLEDVAAARRPSDPAASDRHAQAVAYLRRFDHEASVDAAIGLLEALLESEGESATVHAALARAYLHKYRRTKQRVWEGKAARSCEIATRLAPEDPEVLLARADVHVVLGSYAEAVRETDGALAARPEYFEAHLVRARALEGAGRLTEAEDACRQAVAMQPEDWRGYHELALHLFRYGRYGEAIGPWRKVIELVPDHATAHRNLGTAFYHLDRHDEAIQAFTRSNTIHPDARAFSSLGAVLFNLGRYEESVVACEKAAALSAHDPYVWGNLGNACRRVSGAEERQREALERAVGLMRERHERSAGTGEEWARMAGWLANLDRREESEQALATALQRSPNDVTCMVEAALTNLHLGRRDQALHWLRRAVAGGYGVASLRRSPELSALAGDPEFERSLALSTRSSLAHPQTEEGK